MEYKQFYIEGLFGLYNHTIDFSTSITPNKRASIIMLYGKNGIGKTTILRMIEGFMQLDFTVFREVKFNRAFLKFSNNEAISVTAIYNANKVLKYLQVDYKKIRVKLDPKKTGPLNPKEEDNQSKIKEKYKTSLKDFSFEFIDTERLIKKNLNEEMIFNEQIKQGKLRTRVERSESSFLSEKVRVFITESQVYNSRFFSRDEPELFERILSNIEYPTKIDVPNLKKKISSIVKFEKDFQFERLGITKEKWDKDTLTQILLKEHRKKEPSVHKLTIINSYLEVLESRNNEKISLAERLLMFENLLNEFLQDKTIAISRDKGFEITSINGDIILESQLSTGEYHLIYLTVLALCTTVKGTVIAIDEPEMSMHINWQSKLIKALLKISSKANPQFIFATHSPDIAANYSNSLKTTFNGNNRKNKA
jgi:predicted ATPase